MSLDYFQEQLQGIYEINVKQRAHDFLLTDEIIANQLSGAGNTCSSRERLLIAECDQGLDISLYISAEVMQMLDECHPTDLLRTGNYAEFCLILEGVSHFLYLLWNASHDRQVTLFEMELQAEIDKFVLLVSMDQQHREHVLDSGHIGSWLFEGHAYDDWLNADELLRYERANYFAGKYCQGLQQQFRVADMNQGLLNELRRFYRYGREEKLRYINKLN
ncbi:MAG: hypothetical protein RLT87_07195 [Gammaproteobacteria bacterium]